LWVDSSVKYHQKFDNTTATPQDKNMPTGVYCIRNLITGSLYIGSSARGLTERFAKHRWELRNFRHANHHLQAAWRFYGEPSFRFAVVEECPPEKCIEREQWFIDIFAPEYNICQTAGSPTLGKSLSPEHRAKIGAASKGHVLSAAARAKVSAAMLGNRRMAGHHHTPATREKMRVAAQGRIISPATRAKASAALKGRPNPHSPEARANMSIAARARCARYSLSFQRNSDHNP
jgi:group I intron endonuclease